MMHTSFVKALLCTALALPAVSYGGNVWENPGFETWDAKKNQPGSSWRWKIDKKDKFEIFERTAREKHSGKYSLHVKDSFKGNLNQGVTFVMAGEYDMKQIAGRILRFSAWVKQEAASNPKDVGLGLRIEYMENGKRQAVYAGTGTGSVGKTGWVQIKTKIKVPEKPILVFATLNCATGWGNTGEIYVDDVVLTTDEPGAAVKVAKQTPAPKAAPKAPAKAQGDTPELKAYRESYRNQKPTVDDPRERPVIKDGTWYFHGKPSFFVGVWLYNATHGDWPEIPGKIDLSRPVETLKIDPASYMAKPDERLNINHPAYQLRFGKDIFEYMGFNSSQISAAFTLQAMAIHGLPLYTGKTYWKQTNFADEEKKVERYFKLFGDFPLVMDFAFGYHGAMPKDKRKELDQCNGIWHEFIPFCPEHPEGDAYYRDYFLGGTRAAMRYGANTYLYELFNESSYNCQCRFNARDFANRMQKKYGTIAAANKVWGTIFDDWDDVASQTNFGQFKKLWPDWCKFNEARYVEILNKYKNVIRSVDKRKNIYFTEQPSGIGRQAMDYRLIGDAMDVITIEGGFRYGFNSNFQARNEMEAVVATGGSYHFFNCDFFNAIAKGKKPVNDHEHYCTRIEHGIRVPSKREDMITSLWLETMHGVSASYTYVWDKRGWEANTYNKAKNNVIKPSYKGSSLLNPYNWPPDQLDAFKRFRMELAPYEDKVMPFPRTKPATVAVFFSYPTYRMQQYMKKNYQNLMTDWYTKILHAHFPTKVVFEQEIAQGLPGVQAVVVPGAVYMDPATVKNLEAFQKRGGLVIVSDDSMQFDEYSNKLGAKSKFLVVKTPKDAVMELNNKQIKRYGKILPGDGKALFTQSDIQIIDRGDFKLISLVSLGTMESRIANVQLYLANANMNNERFYVTNVTKKQLVMNGDKETWSLSELLKGFPIILPPQERVIVTLEKKRPAGVTNCPVAMLRKQLENDLKIQGPKNKAFYDLMKKKKLENLQGRTFTGVNVLKCRSVDLRKVVNMDFKDEIAGDKKGGWFDQGHNDFACMPLGKQNFAGVPFEIIDPATNNHKGVLVLWGSHRDFFPVSADGIKVGMKAKNIYFLHTMGWEGKHVLTYRIHYKDGTATDIKVMGGKHIAGWWGAPLLPEAKLAVESHNTEKSQICMHAFRWTNPNPGKEIASLDIISQKCEALPAVAAITVEQP